MKNENIGKPKYGLVGNGIFSGRIVAGLVTGVQYTDDKPIYTIQFGNDSWQTSEITDSIEDLLKHLKIESLERVMLTHNLKIKYK